MHTCSHLSECPSHVEQELWLLCRILSPFRANKPNNADIKANIISEYNSNAIGLKGYGEVKKITTSDFCLAFFTHIAKLQIPRILPYANHPNSVDMTWTPLPGCL